MKRSVGKPCAPCGGPPSPAGSRPRSDGSPVRYKPCPRWPAGAVDHGGAIGSSPMVDGSSTAGDGRVRRDPGGGRAESVFHDFESCSSPVTISSCRRHAVGVTSTTTPASGIGLEPMAAGCRTVDRRMLLVGRAQGRSGRRRVANVARTIGAIIGNSRPDRSRRASCTCRCCAPSVRHRWLLPARRGGAQPAHPC